IRELSCTPHATLRMLYYPLYAERRRSSIVILPCRESRRVARAPTATAAVRLRREHAAYEYWRGSGEQAHAANDIGATRACLSALGAFADASNIPPISSDGVQRNGRLVCRGKSRISSGF